MLVVRTTYRPLFQAGALPATTIQYVCLRYAATMTEAISFTASPSKHMGFITGS